LEGESKLVIYTVRIINPIINQEIMKLETDDETLALMEAEYFSRRHGIAEVLDNSSNSQVARFRYGVIESSQE
jgi:hypothetical protein